MDKLIFLAVLIGTLFSSYTAAAQDTIVIDDFEHGLSSTWRTKSFHGETRYEVVTVDGSRVLQATSDGTASGLIFEREFDVAAHPILSWRWKVSNIIEQGDYRQKATDDYAARVYVMFPHWFFLNTTSLNYIWANRLPKGGLSPNAFTANAMMIAVESGRKKVGEWVACRRNIVADYRRAFGTDPPKKAVIAIMTDTDNTNGQASAWYDDIRLTKE